MGQILPNSISSTKRARSYSGFDDLRGRIGRFSGSYDPKVPEFFLLATSDSYFVYNATDGEDGLRTAGETLEDVYNGLRDWRWADSSEDPWGFVEEEEWLDPTQYFPHYYRKDNGNFGVVGWGPEAHKEYPGKP